MKSWLFLGVAIFCEVVATSSLKASQEFSKVIPSIIVVIGYVGAFYFLSLALRTIPVGIAYAIWAGLGIVAVAAISWFVYGQKLDFPAIIGISLILCGVIVLNIFSKSVAH